MSFRPRFSWSTCLATGAVLLATRAFAQACIGDCNSDGHVQVDELVVCVDVGLGNRPLADCPVLDEDSDQQASIAELIGAVTSLLEGCPATPTPTPTASPTPTPTPNLPPVLSGAPIYRTYPDFAVAAPLFLEDPEGGAVVCSSDALPDGASINQAGVLEWLPGADQTGPFHVPYRCADDATPPAASEGELTLKVQPRDTCVIPTCDPASGCVGSLPPLDEACCAGEPAERIAEPYAPCPEGLVVFAGRNPETGFGRLQNCDKLWMIVRQQSGGEVRFNIKTRCMNTNSRVSIRARLETSSSKHPLAFDFTARLFPMLEEDGFEHYFQLGSGIDGGGPFFDLEDAEANLIITATDLDGTTVSNTTRVILTSTPIPDLPDLDEIPPP